MIRLVSNTFPKQTYAMYLSYPRFSTVEVAQGEYIVPSVLSKGAFLLWLTISTDRLTLGISKESFCRSILKICQLEFLTFTMNLSYKNCKLNLDVGRFETLIFDVRVVNLQKYDLISLLKVSGITDEMKI